MNRRNMLVATVGSLACAGASLAHGTGGWRAPALLDGGAACALLPLQSATGGGVTQVNMTRFFPSAVRGPGLLTRFDLDLRVLDGTGALRTVHAWQLRRSTLAQDVQRGGFRMRFDTHAIDIVAHLRAGAEGPALRWSGRLPAGVDSLLVTPRLATGLPPRAADLHFDAQHGLLSMRDGSARDFDAVLLTAA